MSDNTSDTVDPWQRVFGTYDTPAGRLPYRPFIGLAVAPTWGDLARWINRVLAAATDAERVAIANEWSDEINRFNDPEFDYSVAPLELIAFTETAVNLFERKLHGEPIADKANELIAPMRELVIEDRGKRLIGRQNGNAFWAFEYYFLFTQLMLRNSAWWNAVGYCENETCRKFFIRHRADNRFDSDKCRQNAANRKHYRRRVRSHGGSK